MLRMVRAGSAMTALLLAALWHFTGLASGGKGAVAWFAGPLLWLALGVAGLVYVVCALLPRAWLLLYRAGLPRPAPAPDTLTSYRASAPAECPRHPYERL